MQHPVQYLSLVTRYLDGVLDDYALELFAVLVVLCFIALIWATSRRNRRGEIRIQAVILPLSRPTPPPESLDPPPFGTPPAF